MATRKEPDTSPDAVQLLERDHTTVRELAQQFGEATSSQSRRLIAHQLFTALDVHAALEETIFYPAIAKTGTEGRDLVAEAIQEHREVKQYVAALQTLALGDEEFGELFTLLTEAVEHHAQEEEAEMFPKTRDVLGDELEALGLNMHTLKQQLMATRSYPPKAA